MTDPIHIDRIDRSAKEIVLLAPCHIDDDTLARLEAIIAEEAPDAVCLGIDEQRFQWSAPAQDGEELDLMKALRNGQGEHLWSYLALGVLDKRFVHYEDVRPGCEMHTVAAAAAACDATVTTIDRPMVTTCLRTWRHCSLWQRVKLGWLLTWGLFKRHSAAPSQAPSTSEVAPQWPLAQALRERTFLDQRVPKLCQVVLDESGQYMAQRIAETPGDKVVVLTTPAYADAIAQALAEPAELDPQELEHIPPKSLTARVFPWALTVAIVGLFVLGFAFGDVDKMTDAAVAWILCNGILASLGAILSLAHPITTVAVFIAAPIVSLNPAIGAGLVGLVVQAIVVPPTLRDMECVGDDLAHWTGWWRNRMARLLVIFVLVNLGSTIGSFAALAWFPNIF